MTSHPTADTPSTQNTPDIAPDIGPDAAFYAARQRRSVAIAACLGGFIMLMFIVTLVHLQGDAIGPCKTGYTIADADRCAPNGGQDSGRSEDDALPIGPIAPEDTQ